MHKLANSQLFLAFNTYLHSQTHHPCTYSCHTATPNTKTSTLTMYQLDLTTYGKYLQSVCRNATNLYAAQRQEPRILLQKRHKKATQQHYINSRTLHQPSTQKGPPKVNRLNCTGTCPDPYDHYRNTRQSHIEVSKVANTFKKIAAQKTLDEGDTRQQQKQQP